MSVKFGTLRRWRGHCPKCDRNDVEVEPRDTHYERVLCDRCAETPFTIDGRNLDAPARRTGKTADLQVVAGHLAARGLRPIVDEVLQSIRADCPKCRAGAHDPDGFYRPLIVAPRPGRILWRCEVCDA